MPSDDEIQIARAIAELIAVSRATFATLLPPYHDGEDYFDATVWDITPLITRSTRGAGRRLYFTRKGTKNSPLPPHFANVIKSWIVLQPGVALQMANRLDAARYLWEAVLARRQGDPQAFAWNSLSPLDLSEAELLMREHLALSTVYMRASILVGLNEFLAARAICRPLYYQVQAPRIESLDRTTIAGQEARRAKLPSQRTLDGLADIYAHLATEPRDRLSVAAIALLVVTGLRISELLTLPFDCEEIEVRGGKERYGLRYHVHKAQGARKYDVRWVTSVGSELARQSVAEIRAITAEARERARVLESNPDTVPLPGYHSTDTIRATDLAIAMGMRRVSLRHIPADKLPCQSDQDGDYYLVADVQRYLYTERVERLWTIKRGDGTYQPLSETLLIACRYFFHAIRGTNPLLVEPVTIQHIGDFITGRPHIPSVFARFDIKEQDGTFCRVTPHQFRHWLNDLADKGGLPVDMQTRWMGRQHSRDTHAYRHATTEERVAWIKQSIRDGAMQGTLADVYDALPVNERDSFLDGQVQAVHITPMGICIHDFAVEPCPYHLNCLRGCPDYLRTKGNKQEIIHLTEVRRQTEQALSMAQEHARSSDAEAARPWVDSHTQLLVGINAALAIEEDSMYPDGVQVRPFVTNSNKDLSR